MIDVLEPKSIIVNSLAQESFFQAPDDMTLRQVLLTCWWDGFAPASGVNIYTVVSTDPDLQPMDIHLSSTSFFQLFAVQQETDSRYPFNRHQLSDLSFPLLKNQTLYYKSTVAVRLIQLIFT